MFLQIFQVDRALAACSGESLIIFGFFFYYVGLFFLSFDYVGLFFLSSLSFTSILYAWDRSFPK